MKRRIKKNSRQKFIFHVAWFPYSPMNLSTGRLCTERMKATELSGSAKGNRLPNLTKKREKLTVSSSYY